MRTRNKCNIIYCYISSMKDQTMQIPGLHEEKKSFIIMENRFQDRHPLHLANSANSDPQRPPSRNLPIAHNITQQSQPIEAPVIQQSIRTSHSHAPLPYNTSNSEVSQSVRSINQKLGDLSTRIKEGRPVMISYGEQGRPPVNVQQTTISRGNNVISGQQQVQFRYIQQEQQYQQGRNIQGHHSQPHSQQQQPPIQIIHPQQHYPQMILQHPQHPHAPPPQIIPGQFPAPSISQPTQPQQIHRPHSSSQHTSIWQTRYLMVMDRFENFTQKFSFLTGQYTMLRQEVEKCENLSEFEEFKHDVESFDERMQEAEQELRDILQKNREDKEEAIDWRTKYQELLRKTQNKEEKNNVSDRQPPQLTGKLQQLEHELLDIGRQHKQTTEKLKQQSAHYEKKINQLNDELERKLSQIESFERKVHHHTDTIKSKEEEIATLRMLVQKQSQAQFNTSIPTDANDETLSKKILTLKREKEELVRSLDKKEEELEDAMEKIQDYKIQIRKKNDEIKRYQYLVQEKDQQLISSISSQAQSNSNLNQNNPRDSQLYASQVKTIKDKLQQYEDQLMQFNAQRESLSKKAGQYEADLKIKNQIIKDLEEKLNKQNVNNSQINISTSQQKLDESSIDIVQLNENMVQLQKYYQQKCIENEQYKKICSEYEGIINQCKLQYKELQDKHKQLIDRYDEMSSKMKGSRALSKQSEESEVSLKSKVEDLEKKLKRIHQLQVENEKLKKEINGIEETFKKVRQQMTGSQSSQQLQLLEQALLKKDQEITRLRQTKDLLQSHNDQMTLELQQLKMKNSSDFKTQEGQKGQLKQQLVTLQFKLEEYQRKKNSLEEVKSMLEEQISQVTTQLHARIEQVQRLESQLRQERVKGKAFQNDLQIHLTQTEENKLRLKENERKSHQIVKALQAELDKKKEEAIAKTSELVLLNNRIGELESKIKTKEGHITELERNSDSLKNKISSFDTYLDEIKYLKQKIIQYESKVSSLAFRPLSRNNHSEPTQIFERKVIYQLKLQNEALRQKLGMSIKVQGKAESEQEVRERLTDFNHRLEQVIGQNFSGQLNSEQGELFKRYERDRRKLIERHNEEITQLKIKILELQSGSSEPVNQFPSAQSVYNEQILFYRQKNHELEQRVDNHIKVNRQLRESIQRLMKGQNDEYSISYYKDQLNKTTEINIVLQEKIRRLQAELKKLREELDKCNSRPVDNSTELQVRIVELNRRISQLVMEINLLQEDKVSSNSTIASLEQQLFRLKNEIQEINSSKLELSRVYKEKEGRWEEELTKVNNKVRLQISEIERLNELLSKKQQTESTEVQGYKLRINQCQEQIRRLRLSLEQSNSNQEQLRRQITKLQSQIQALYLEIQRQKENTEMAIRKHSDYDLQVTKLRNTIVELQNKLRGRETANEEWNYREGQLQQEITRLNSQLGLMTQQIERNKQYGQKRVNQKEAELSRLRIVVNEKSEYVVLLEQQLAQGKVQSGQVNQQIYFLEQQLNKVKGQLSIKISQYDKFRVSHQEQINELSGSYQLRIAELQETIRRLEYSLESAQRNRSDSNTLQNSIGELERQLMQLQRAKDEEVTRLKEVISRLERERQEYIGKENQFRARISELERILREKEAQAEEKCRVIRIDSENQISSKLQLVHSLEQQILDLKAQLTSRDGNGQHLQSIVAQLEQELRIIKLQLEQKDLHLRQISQQLAVLEQRLYIFEQEQSRYRTHISQLEKELQHLTQLHRKLYESSIYTIQYLRSTLIGVETVFQEEQNVGYAVSQTIGKFIMQGLEECQVWSEGLNV